MKIERSADDVCLAFLLERSLSGEEPVFEGEIVGLVAKGAFIRFGDEGFEGFLPARRLRDWYELNEEETALIGRGLGPRAADRRPDQGRGGAHRGAARPRGPDARRLADQERRSERQPVDQERDVAVAHPDAAVGGAAGDQPGLVGAVDAHHAAAGPVAQRRSRRSCRRRTGRRSCCRAP